MGRDPEREAPFFFMKPACAVVGASTEEVAIAYCLSADDFELPPVELRPRCARAADNPLEGHIQC